MKDSEDPAEEARRLTIALGESAGELVGQKKFEPQGYVRLPLSRLPPRFGFAYAKDSGEVVLIDSRAGDLVHDAIEGPDGAVYEPGTHVWVQYVLSKMQRREPEVAKTITAGSSRSRTHVSSRRRSMSAATSLWPSSTVRSTQPRPRTTTPSCAVPAGRSRP